MPKGKEEPEVRIGHMKIEIPVIIEFGKLDKVALITGGLLLATEVLKLLSVIKLPLQEEKNLTVTIPNPETGDVTVMIPLTPEKVVTEA